MAATNRLLSVVLAGVFAVLITACASSSATECDKAGVYCPKGTHCAAVQGVCIPDANKCGDGHVDTEAGEVCDDGNTLPGDGCSADCKSNEQCGNGTLDTPIKDAAGNILQDPRNEDCDTPLAVDPNTGKYCSRLCKFEVCGNGVKDEEVHEICDDGNTVGGDGCSADCRSTELCGNGILDQPFKDMNGNPDLNNPKNEVCDDGNTLDGDGCSSDCRSAEGCGNGKLDPGEECDLGKTPDGQLLNGDDKDCRSDCVINRCGDGRPNTHGLLHHEDCDGGKLRPDHDRGATPNETADCNLDCTIPSCGDGKVNHSFTPPAALGPEQCDDGNNDINDGCSPTCQFERCGNGLLDPQEECDGNAGLQPCNLQTCLQERCGNGILDDDLRTAVHEQCDDHNISNNDGCSSTCVIEFCGDGVTNNHEACDPTDLQFGPARCNADCTPASCGDGKLNLAAGEQCDDGGQVNGDGCSSTCQFERCGNGVLDPEEQCDGTLGKQPCNTQTCLQEICGNGILDKDVTTGIDEQCDDRNSTEGDGCSSDCKIEFCGDGVTNNHEACDPTDPAFGPARCNVDCTQARCGDNIVNVQFKPNGTDPEQCDPPSVTNGCSSDCRFEHCGNGVKDPGEECDKLDFGPGGNPNGLICSLDCHIERCGNGIKDPGEQCDDGKNDDGDGCSALCKLEFCGDGVTNNHEACDPTDPAFGPTRCNVGCTLARCGDNIVNVQFKPNGTDPEQCDPPSVTNGCSSDCRFEHCGNGVKDPGEECDKLDFGPGGNPNGLICSPDCHIERCGNGIIDPTEQCDLGTDGRGTNNNTDDSSCPQCHIAVCGDGRTLKDLEQCDDGDGNPKDSAACDHDCTFAVCGDSYTNTLANEECDDGKDNGTLNSTNHCSATCRRAACGNGVIEQGEQCDDGVPDVSGNPQRRDSATCNSDCTVSRCGDAHTNLSAGEQCDLGESNSDTGACTNACRSALCGDGLVEASVEACDDGSRNGHESCPYGALSCTVCGGTCQLVAGAVSFCGDTATDSANGEECDDGQLRNGKEICAYNTPCQVCDATCHSVAGATSFCGDGITNTPDETCDDGTQNGHESCPYGALSCTVCDATCHLASGAVSLCGDGVLDNGEVCDDGNTSCGACSSDCKTITSGFALGSITVPAGDHFKTGDTFVVSDGATVAIFEVTVVVDSSVMPSAPALDIIPIVITNSTANGPESSSDIASEIVAQINANLSITATSQSQVEGATLVALQHQFNTSNGNQPIVSHFALTGGPGDFQVTGMVGGEGGNCAAGQACTQNADCTSNHCVGADPSTVGTCDP